MIQCTVQGLAVLVLTVLMCAAPALAWEYNLQDTARGKDEWRVTSDELGVRTAHPFSVTTRALHGGREEGVTVVEIDNGRMKIRVCPTRGMGVLDAVAGGVRLGWNSPVKEIVNPAFMNLESRGGLGWLDGFNELVVRCGYEWTGHPGIDNGVLLTLHGRAENTPAADVFLTIDKKVPHAIHLSGVIREQMFKKVNFHTRAELVTEPGSLSFTLHDVLTNAGSYPQEYQVLYHSNFGPPLLEKGAKFSAPVKEVSPFNVYAEKDLDTWQSYRGPTPGFDEMVYNIYPLGDDNGHSLAVLHNAAGSKGVSLAFNLKQLPVLSLWKNTDTLEQGYVTGLEPGTSLAYNRRFQRALGLVPKIGPHETRQFDLTYTLLDDHAAVAGALQRVASIQGDRKTAVKAEPPVDLVHNPE